MAAGLPVLSFPQRGEINPAAILRMRSLLRRHRPDLVAAHDPHSLTVAALGARLVGPRPAVIGHRRVDFHLRPHAFSRWKYARGPDHLVAVSGAVREVLIEDGVPPDRVTVIHSGIALDTPPAREGPSLRSRIGAPPEAPIVLTIASTVGYKDHPTLIEAAAALRPRDPMTRWAVLGSGGLLEEMRSRVAERGLAGRVHYLGFVPGARGFLPEADLFVLTSRTEGLGTSVLDAMAAGVPIVATRAGGVPEMIEDGITGLLAKVGEGPAVAERIDRLLDDRVLARRLASRAAERVRDFDIDRTVERTERLYREVLARHRSHD